MEKVRIFRILCYEGDRDWVEKTIKDSIHGEKVLTRGCIKAVTIDVFPKVDKTDEMAYAMNAFCDRVELGISKVRRPIQDF